MPGKRCTVAVCNNSLAKTKHIPGPTVSYHRFPKNPVLRKQWIHLCRRDGEWNPDSCHICSDHFNSQDFERHLEAELMNLPIKRILKSGAIPSRNLGENVTEKRIQQAEDRDKRSRSRCIKQEVKKLLTTEEPDASCNTLDLCEKESSSISCSNCSVLKSQNSEMKISIEKLSLQLQEMSQKLKFCQEQLSANRWSLKVKTLQSKKYQSSNAKKNKQLIKTQQTLERVFTPTQIKVLVQNKKRVKWETEDITRAFTLRYFSKRAYLFLRNTLKFPLPGISTLQKWSSRINMRQGILEDVLHFMNIASADRTDEERLAVLQYDEMKVMPVFEYDTKNDQIIGPHNQMQVIMVRGLIANWKQIVYVDFDQKVTKDILMNVISRLHACKYEIVACVSDCGGGNLGLWKTLGISIKQPWFEHPKTSKKIYQFADAPHMLKLVRNWFIDTGFTLRGGELVNKDPVVELIKSDNSEIKVLYKLTDLHVNCGKVNRQTVRLAANLLSHSTATAIKRYNFSSPLAQSTANFIELCNFWFDLMNTRVPRKSMLPSQCGYGIYLEDQNQLLEDMYATVLDMRCVNKKGLQVFQKGILISITSLKMLLIDVRNRCSNISYILTHKINQDSLENLFSQVRTRGGLNDHPMPLAALYRLRMIMLGKTPGIVQKNLNTIDNSSEVYVVAQVLKQSNVEVSDEPQPAITSSPVNNCTDNTLQEREQNIMNNGELISEFSKDALEYLAGWIAKKFKETHPHLGQHTYKIALTNLPSWVQQLSFGGLIKPEDSFVEHILLLEKYFKEYHGATELKKNKAISMLTQYIVSKGPDFDKVIVQAFVKQRTFIRMNFLNAKLRTEKRLNNFKRKNTPISEKVAKKMKKLTNS